MSAAIQTPARAKTSVAASWVIRILLALAFLAAAGAKLAGVPMMVEVFNQIGLGQGFRYVTACVEIAGVFALFVPGLTALAGLWLGTTMVFAFLAHILALHSNPAGSVVLCVLSLTVSWLHRGQLTLLRARFV